MRRNLIHTIWTMMAPTAASRSMRFGFSAGTIAGVCSGSENLNYQPKPEGGSDRLGIKD